MQLGHVETGAAPLNWDRLDRDNRWPFIAAPHDPRITQGKCRKSPTLAPITPFGTEICHICGFITLQRRRGRLFSPFGELHARLGEGGFFERPAEIPNGRTGARRARQCGVVWKFGSFHGRLAKDATMSKINQLSHTIVRSILFQPRNPYGGIRLLGSMAKRTDGR